MSFEWIGVIAALLAVGGLLWSIATWCANVNHDRKDFKAFMNKVSKQLEKISHDILSLNIRFEGKTIERKSPYELNELGKKVLEKFNGNKIAEQLSESLFDKARVLDTNYEIQELSFRFVHGKYEPEKQDLIEMQESAYNNDISMKDVKDVVAILLRDILLKKTGRIIPNN
ncbi:MAG: hypothetical protein OXC02_02905 [Rhodobacteraceae bacterium]|nr:hypothetical protein [Paracoccaceae bacterium]